MLPVMSQPVFEMSAMLTNCVTDPLLDGSVSLCGKLVATESEFDVSLKYLISYILHGPSC